MVLKVGLFFISVIFMTFLSVMFAFDIRTITRFTKKNIMAWLPTAGFALCISLSLCLAVWLCWVRNWNLPGSFSDGLLAALSYQQVFDLSLLQLIVCVGSVLTGLLLKKFQETTWTTGKSRNLMGLFLFSCLFLLVAVFFFVGIQGQNHIVISEFYLPDKKTTLENQDAFIEIANSGILSYEMTGIYLSDDRNNLQKMQISQEKIPSKGTILLPVDSNVFAFGEKGGDMLILSNQNGEIIDEVITSDTRRNKSYTRNYADKTWEYRDPSPGVYNLEKPQFSVAPGFYYESFYVALYAQDGADIYYTLDGSIPTIHSEKYSKKILVYDRSEEPNQFRSIQNVTINWMEQSPDPAPVPKATVLRAIAVDKEGAVSEIATATYFVKQDAYRGQCVVSLVADPEDLFGPQGIYSTGETYDQWYLNGQIGEMPMPNYEIRGLECSGNFELFHGTPQGYLNQTCGVRIQGGSHRKGFLKRMSVFSREEYSGDEFFEQNIFGNRRTHSVALREGFENAFTMELVPQRNLATQSSIPVSVFLNGEYWYDTYLQEKYSDEFFEEIYQLEDVEFIKAGVTWDMLEFVQENDMQSADAYQRLNEMIDIQSYIDFMCANIYLANTDFSESTSRGNSAIWRSRIIENQDYGDGRWRWALYDMDLITSYCRWELGLDDITDAELNTFTTMREWTEPLEERPFYAGLKQNAQFRQQFVLTFMDMANTCFKPDFVEGVLDKWGGGIDYNDSFFLNRNTYVTQYLAEAFALTGTRETLVISADSPISGCIQVNTCNPDFVNGVWTGTYFTDYPVTVTAKENDGYKFVRWEGDIHSESPMISFTLPEGGLSIHAVYAPYEN